MTSFTKRYLPLLALTGLLLAVFIVFLRGPASPPPVPVAQPKPPESPALSMLAAQPDWSALETYQETISREDFERLLTTVFTTGQAWQTCISIDETGASILTGNSPDEGTFRLRFATPGQEKKAPRDWRSTAELPAATVEKPLEGLKIAIDPGHIGGAWAKMEERWFILGDGTPVCEGDMTLQVSNLLKPRLEALGATVSLVRGKTEPVTTARPEALRTLAQDTATPEDSPAALQRLAERLFYRTAEIRARADLVNQTLKPDLVLCLHFNAEAWGDPNKPTLVDRTHLHLLLNGAYNDEEVHLADQRFALLKKLLQRTHQEEVRIGSTVAADFAKASGLPPYVYPAQSPNVRAVPDQPYLWVRNLLANRLYDCPVIFMEPYVMNSTIDYPRIQAGDYEGIREIGGKMQASILREYADALVTGLVTHYSAARVSAGE
jgi:N-acetylmuramoyl-L-alanine amidase